MLFRIFRNSAYDFKMKITLAVFSVVIVLFSLTIHEFSHALTAKALGDPTAKERGRLTLNPLKHLNPIGTIMMLLFGFGYAEPVPINPNYFKHRKTGMAITAFAGPLSNFIVSFVALFGYSLSLNKLISSDLYTESQIMSSPLYILSLFFWFFHTMNLYLAIFNLIPVPPLDGSRILFIFLPAKYYFRVMRYEQYIAIGLIALLYFGVLDGPLSFITGSITNGMLKLIDLII